jgi:hypothetical protein
MVFHHKRKDISRLTAAKTVKKLLPRMNGKRGCFFMMKRTKPEIPDTASPQVHMLTDNLDNIGTLLDVRGYFLSWFCHWHLRFDLV